MTEILSNNKRIAKNTLIMYMRMFIMMLIGLYTSRVILNILGITDYGIYNIVGGLVGMFSIVSSSLSSSVSRYLTFEIGKGNIIRLKEIFSTSVIAQFGMSLLVIILIEIIGVWFLYNKMNIPAERLDAAAFILQCSIISFALGLIMMPYNATIIAHERFDIYAYLTLFDAFMKLVVAFSLSVSTFDKLKTYAVLLLIVAMLVQFIYFIYCRRNFEECHFRLRLNKSLLKEVFSFAGWNFLGSTSWIFNTQGIDLLINFFFGVTLNAARGIASQVNNIVQGFISNFTTTLYPQITKSYAKGDMKYMREIVYAGTKYSYFLMLFFSIPLCLETKQILVLWLKIIPEYSVPFVRLTLIATMAFVLGNTLSIAQGATGKLKRFSILTSLFTFLEFPLVFVFFHFGYPPQSCYIIHIIIYGGLLFLKIYIVKKSIGFTYMSYIREVIIKAIIVSFVSVIFPISVYLTNEPTFIRLILVCVISIISSLLSICYLGMEQRERQFVFSVIRKKLFKK